MREALASDRLEDFVRQEEARGVELANGSDLERALALLITQRRSKIDHSRRRLRKSSAAEADAGNAVPKPHHRRT